MKQNHRESPHERSLFQKHLQGDLWYFFFNVSEEDEKHLEAQDSQSTIPSHAAPAESESEMLSKKDQTQIASLLVSIAALILSASSFYQTYLNRLYTEDINRPVLTTALAAEGLFTPSRGWVIGNSKLSNVGKMTAIKVVEKTFRFSANGFDDDCFILGGKTDTKKDPKEILPGGFETFAYIVVVQPRCLAEVFCDRPRDDSFRHNADYLYRQIWRE